MLFRSHAHTHTLTHTLSPTLSHAHTHTLTHTHTHSHTLTHTHTREQPGTTSAFILNTIHVVSFLIRASSCSLMRRHWLQRLSAPQNPAMFKNNTEGGEDERRERERLTFLRLRLEGEDWRGEGGRGAV